MKPLLKTTTLLLFLTIFSCSKKADDPAPTPAHVYTDDLVGTWSGQVIFNGGNNTGRTEYIKITKINDTYIHIAPFGASDYMDAFDAYISSVTTDYIIIKINHQEFTSGTHKYIDGTTGSNLYDRTGTPQVLGITVQGTTFGGATYTKKFAGVKQ